MQKKREFNTAFCCLLAGCWNFSDSAIVAEKKLRHLKTRLPGPFRQCNLWLWSISGPRRLFSLNFLTVKELNTEKHFIVWADKLNQHVYYKGIMTSKFESKNMVLWKRGSSFVSIENENLWIASRRILFHGPRPPERLLWTPSKNYFTQLPTEMNLAHRIYHKRSD